MRMLILIMQTIGPPKVASQVIMQTLKKSTCDKLVRKVEKVVATVKTKVSETNLSAMDNSVVPRIEFVLVSWYFRHANLVVSY